MTDDAAKRITGVDDGTVTHSASFDPETEPVSEAVVRVVAAVTGTGPDDLEPIDNVVDPIVFDALVRRQRRNICIEFEYGGQTVTVESAGQVSVRQRLADGGWSESFQFSDGESASETVVRAIAAARGVEPTETSPLYDYIDPESLDRIVSSQTDRATTVSFVYEGLHVIVSSENGVTLYR